MASVRLYSGDDGQSHFEDMDLLPSDLEFSPAQAATSILFERAPDGHFVDWHTSSYRQYAIYLSGGQLEITIGDGTVRRLGPGDIMLSEDLTGRGHTTLTVDGDCMMALVLLVD